MLRPKFVAALIAAALMMLSVCQSPKVSVAQTTAAAKSKNTAVKTVKPDRDKALKYHKALKRRPSPGYLYDRFYNAWLDSSTIDELETFLTQQAKDSSATADRLMLAFFYSKQGDDVKALQQFRTALETDPGNADVWFEKAVVEARTLDFENALKDLEKAGNAKPKQDVAIKIGQLRGKLYVRNRQSDEAIKVWQELIASNPDDSTLVEEVIELQISEGLFDEATRLSDQLIAKTKDPYQKVMRQLRKGDIIQRSGKRDDALKIYGQSLGQVGNDTWIEREILGQIEELFRREDDLIGLKDHLNKMIADNDKRLSLRKSLAKLNVELGMLEEASSQLKAIVELTPGDRENREAYIDMLAKAGKLELAVKQTQSLIGQNADDPELRLKLARLHHQAKSTDDAAAAVGEFVKVADESEYAYLRAARLLDRFQNKTKAAGMFAKCIEKFPDSETAQESYADHLYKSDKKADAIKLWNKLAEGGDRARTVRVARLLSARKEHQAAFDLLHGRFDEFKNHSGYLGQLCAEAISLKKIKQAVPWAMDRVKFAKTVGELKSCLGQAVQVISKSDQVGDIIDQLQAKTDRNVASTCLLAELFDQTSDGDKADQLLASKVESLQAENSGASDSAKNQSLQMLANQRVTLLSNRLDWAAAAKAAQQMIELPGGRKSTNVRRLVELFVRDGQLNSALTWVDQWKKISPGSLLPWFNESTILNRLGRLEDSISVLRVAAQKFPKDADLHMLLGKRYLENGQYKDAQRVYWRQYENSESLSDKLRWTQQLADTADDMGETEELIAKFEERKKKNPKSIEPLLSLAQAHRVADNYEERRKALLEATRLQKDNLPLLLEIARLEESEGDWEKAIQTLQQAKRLDKSGRVQEKIAVLYMEYGESERGYVMLVELAGGVKSGPRDIEKIAIAISSTGDWEKTHEFLQTQITRFPDDYRIQYLMAVVKTEALMTNDAADLFVRLLSNQKEISGLKTTTAGNALAGQVSMFESMLPADAIEFVKLSVLSSTLNRSGSGSSFGGSSNPSIQLPSSAEMCRLYALSNLTTIIAELPEDEAEALVSSMKVAGVSNAKFLTEIETDYGGIFRNGTELLEEHPDNDMVLALSLFSVMSDQAIDPQMAAKAYKKFNERYPELAFIAALQAAGGDEKHHALLDKALAINAEYSPGYITISLVSRYLSGSNDMQESFEHKLTKTHIASLNKRLREWFAGQNTSSQYAGYTFEIVASSLKSGESAKPFVEFLDEEIARLKTKNRNPRSSNTFFGWRGHSEEFINLIPLPPEEFVNFPDQIVSVIDFGEENDYDSPFGNNSLDPKSWSEKLAKEVGSAKDPMLKVILQIAVTQLDDAEEVSDEQYQAIEKLLAPLLASEKPDPDAFLLAAGLASAQSNWQRTSELLEKMRSLPLTRQMRKTVDGALVATATEGLSTGFESPKNSAVVQSAKAAALRLRRHRVSSGLREQLLVSMESLGMTKEAEKMEEKIAGMNSPSVPGMFGGYTPSRGNATKDRVRELVDTGKTDAAVRILATEFRSLARGVLDVNSQNVSSYELREFSRKIKSMGVLDEFVKQLETTSETNHTRLAAYALALEVADLKEEAIEAYEKVLAVKKDFVGVRTRLLMTKIKSEQNVSDLLVQFDEKTGPMFAGQLMELINQDQLKTEVVFDFVEKATAFAQKRVKDKPEDTAWLMSFSSWMASRVSFNNSYLPNLHARQPKETDKKESSKRSAKFEKLLDRRAKAHKALCETMLKVPSVAPEAFTELLRVAEARDPEKLDAFAPLALEAILTFKEVKQSQSASHTVYHSYYSSYDSDEDTPPERTPEDFIVRFYGHQPTADREKNLASVYEKLSTAKLEAKQESIKQRVKLYAAKPEEFVEVAKSFFETQKKSAKRRRDFDPNRSMSLIIEAWEDTDTSVNLDEFVGERIKDKKRSSMFGGYDGPPGYLSMYLVGVAKHGSADRVRKIMDGYAGHVFGSREKQTEMAEKIIAAGSSRRGSRQSMTKLQTWAQFMRQITSERELALLAAEEMHTSKLSWDMASLESTLPQMVQAFDDAEELLEWLSSGSPFLNDISDFDPYVNPLPEKEVTLWGQVIERLSYGEFECEEELIKILEAKAEPTFGETLFLFAVDNDRNLNDCYESIGKRLEQVEALPEKQQQRLAQTLSSVANGDALRYRDAGNKLSKVAKKARTFTNGLLGDAIKSKLNKLLAAKKITDLKIEEHEFDDWYKQVLGQIDRADTANFAKAVEKVISLTGTNRRSHYNSFGTSMGNRVLQELLSNETDLESFKLVHHLMESETEKFELSLDEQSLSELSRFLSGHASSLLGDGGGEDVSKVKMLDALYRNLGIEFADLDSAIFIPVFWQTVYGMSPDYAKAIEWAAGEAKSGKHKKLATNMSLALQLAKISAEFAEETKDDQSELSVPARLEQPNEFQTKFMSIIEDPELHLRSRVTIASTLMTTDLTLPSSEVWKCAKLFAEGYQTKLIAPSVNAETRLIWAMNQLDSEAEFTENARAFGTAWSKYHLKRQQNGHVYYSGGSSPLSSRTNQAVELFAKLEDRSTVQKIIRRFESDMRSRAGVGTLIENGFHTQARKICEQLWSNPDSLDFSEDEKAVYSVQLQEELPAFVALFGNDATKLLAESLMASMKNSRYKQRKPETTPEQRLTALAERYPTVKFTSKSQNELALILLASAGNAEEFISGPLDKVATKIKSIDLWDSSGSNDYTLNRNIVGAWLALKFKTGETKIVSDYLDKLLADKPEERDWSFNRLMSELIGKLAKPVKKKILNSSPDEMAKHLPLIRTISDQDFAEYGSGVQLLCATAHVVSGKSDEFLKWVETFERPESDEEEEGEFAPYENADLDESWQILVDYYKGRDQKLTDQQRLELVTKMWQMASKTGFSIGSGHFQSGIQESCSGCRDSMMGLDAIKDAKLLTADEIADHGKLFAEMESVDGEIWRQLAREQIRRKEFEKAAESMKASLDATGKEMKQAKINRTVEYAFVLSKIGRESEIKELIEGVESRQLLGDNKGRFRSLKKKFADE